MIKNIISNTRLLIKLLVVVLILFFGYEVYERISTHRELQKEAIESSIPTVEVIHPSAPNPFETITLPGTVKAWYEAPIYAQVSGYVANWYKDYGAKVKKGDVLAKINVPTLDAEYEQAKADMESQKAKYHLAEITANRYLALEKSNAVSKQSVSVAVADRDAERAKLRAAQKNLKKFQANVNFKTIKAPFDGFVTQRNINIGDYVNKEGNLSDTKSVSNLFTVAEIDKMRLFVSVPGTFAYLLKEGLTADVIVPQFPTRHITADFLTISKGFDQNTRTVIAVFVIENKDHALWPGSYATVNLTAPANTDIISIPSSALVFDENGTQVATVTKDNKIHFKKIKVYKILDTIIELTEGLSESDKIVNNPSAALLEGEEVRIVQPRKGYSETEKTKSKEKNTQETKSEEEK